MVLFALVVVAVITTGTFVAGWLWRKLDAGETTPAELLTSGILIGLAIWLFAHWILALTHLLNATALWTLIAIFFAVTLYVFVRHGRAWASRQMPREVVLAVIAFLPLLVWIWYVLARGVLLPAANHDVLSYHLPKAVLLSRAEGFEVFHAPDHRIQKFPFNYELLLADVLILGKSDTITEWIGTATFLMLLLGAAALAQRWWRSGLAGMSAAVIATATAPVLILHSGADKNDLLTAWFGVCALLWGGRWLVHGGRMPMLLTILALGLGFGTKTSIAALGVAIAILFAIRFIRGLARKTHTLRDLALFAAVSVVVFLLGGGLPFLLNYLDIRAVSRGTLAAASEYVGIGYGDWSNLWQVPYLLLSVPFSGDVTSVWVPWRHEMWFWPHYEIFFSHYGRLFTVLVLLVPLVWWRERRRGDPVQRRERTTTMLAALLGILIMLPAQGRPIGFFGSFPRYFAFIVPVVAAWTLPPIVEMAAAITRRMRWVIVFGLAIVFTLEAMLCAFYDRFAPLQYTWYAWQLGGTRVIWFNAGRAASVVDRMAGPYDKIAVDGAFDTWVYPAYGAKLTRPVVFLPADATPDTIPRDAKWVIVDRSWGAIWGNPKFENFGQARSYLGKGVASPSDLRLYLALRRDPRFVLVYRSDGINQAVFRRVR